MKDVLLDRELMERGREVFGDEEKFKLWLHTESKALGKKPTDCEKEEILDELVRIEHGIL